MFTDGPRAASVLIGFLDARTRIGSPFDVPPSMPPALFVGLRKPNRRSSGEWSDSYVIGSITLDPGRRAASTPRPISTALIAWMLITAAARPAVQLAVPLHVAAEPDRAARDHRFHDAAQRVARFLRRVNRRDDPRVRLRVQRVNRAGIAHGQIK